MIMGKSTKSLGETDSDKKKDPRHGNIAENPSSDSDIDIRLDQDLSNFKLPSEKSLYKDLDLDIDLTGPLNHVDSLVESPVLQIDPVKSFSRHVDINLGRLGRNGYIAMDDAKTPLLQTFRVLKRPLLNNVAGKGATVVDNANLIMLTSSHSGEGKTYSAINLALCMAMEKDKKVLLVDADVSSPSHHEIFGIEMEHGLTDYLTGRVKDVSKIINKTNVPSLSLIFAGSLTAHSIELFASQAMTSFLAELSGRYEDRVVIFDSAPLLLPTEASVLAQHMGQVIVVVEAESTAQSDVKQSIEMLDNQIVLLVLNKVRGKSDIGSYGYGHYGYDKER